VTQTESINTDVNQIELYWMPGCSACLRLKEFMEKSGKEYVAYNCDAEPQHREKLARQGRQVPTLCLGDRCVPGVDLVAVAELIGVDYTPPEMLRPEALYERYLVINTTLQRLTAQLTEEAAAFKLPNRDRTLTQLAGHAGRTMRYFIGKYYDDEYDGEDYLYDAGFISVPELVEYIEETRQMFVKWWETDGSEDPMDDDGTVLSLYWGHRTVHEGLEREVWHTAQHTRQMAHWLEEVGIAPDRPLTAEQLANLPLPERIHD
jgi:glutaredoxin